ncbi:MAG TPA: ATP-binding cassette domain-containing protein [Vicinamibacterales bacterium]|nr:ATP-binding cassette domain-containing protein [Vicinamibacterales bacterium]
MIRLEFTLTQGSFTLQVSSRLSGRTTAIFGHSGAGKTTILDAIAGLRRPGGGRIAIEDRVVFDAAARIDLPPHLRRIGYLPQDIALFPHMNVRANLLYGRHPGASPPLERVARMLEIGGLLDRRVARLSGGERQRVALGRALMSGPALLLLDEPLAAVDVPLRRRIVPYLERVRDEFALPIVWVSHDREEVRRLAEYVLVVDHGRVVRAGPPATVLATDRADDTEKGGHGSHG